MATKEQLGQFIREIIREEVSPIAEAVLELQERLDGDEDFDGLLDDVGVTPEDVVHDGVDGTEGEGETAPEEPAKGRSERIPSDDTSEPSKDAQDLQARLDAIKAMHRLEAIPIAFSKSEQDEWEVRCVVCDPKNFVVWRKGDPNPRPCKTYRLADGELRG